MERLTIRNRDGTVSQPTGTTVEAVFYRLAEYEDAEEQGLLVRLPCKVGDTVWTVNHNGGVCSHQIRRFERNKDGDFACSMLMLPLKGFGKTVFLTREEAEAALKENRMDEYIKRETLYREICELEELARKRVYDTPSTSPAYMRYVTQSQERTNLKNKISELPAADVAPVVHGRWETVEVLGKTARYRCTACKTEMVDYIDRKGYHYYCHKCGAKMQEAR